MRSVVKLYSTKKYLQRDQIEEDSVERARSAHGRDENCIHNFVSTPERKRPLGTISLGCQSNINTSEGSRMFC